MIGKMQVLYNLLKIHEEDEKERKKDEICGTMPGEERKMRNPVDCAKRERKTELKQYKCGD